MKKFFIGIAVIVAGAVLLAVSITIIGFMAEPIMQWDSYVRETQATGILRYTAIGAQAAMVMVVAAILIALFVGMCINAGNWWLNRTKQASR